MSFPEREEHPELDIASSMELVRRATGKSTWEQLREMASLVLGPGGISPWDYYRYQLYDDALYTPAAKREFLGDNSARRTWIRCSNPHWFALADDKLVANALLDRHGLPVPEIRAIHHPFRSFPGATGLRSAEALAAHLRADMEYPFFAKPISGFGSGGVCLVRACDSSPDELILHDGSRVSVDAYTQSVSRLGASLGGPYSPLHDPSAGYVFEEVVRQHPLLEEHCGDGVACVRVYVVVEDDGARILATVWKIPAAGNVADNFWRSGNLLAALDPSNGEVTRVIRGEGTELEELEIHPSTGKRLIGLRLPDFEAVRKLALSGAALFPGLRYQGWDVAIGPDGPLVVEVNSGSAYSLAQLATRKGLLTEEFRDFLTRARLEWPRHPSRWRWLWRLEGAWRFAKALASRPGGRRTGLRP